MGVQSQRRRSQRPPAAVLAVVLLAGPVGVAAQSQAETPDSATLVQQAREAQRNFEGFRQSNIPVQRDRQRGTCDQLIGRICIWFGGEGETDFPPEPAVTEEARRSLIGRLLRVRHEIADPWVVGQLVHYMVEADLHDNAEQVAAVCGLDAAWWCTALLGYSLHDRGQVQAAEATFRESLALMPDSTRQRWTSLRYVLSPDGADAFRAVPPADRAATWDLFWRLSDPLFLVDGNDRFTDHFARLVEARNREGAENPHGMVWEADLEETLIRYGRMIGWSRTFDPPPIQLRQRLPPDTRRIIGHHHPMSRGYLFPEDFLESPADVPPESWITAPREARTWYAPSYAPDMRALDTQVGRFRRGDAMLVVGAYRPEPDADSLSGDSAVARDESAVEAGLFLVPLDGGLRRAARSRSAEGVLTLRGPPGRYVSSLEVLDRDGRRAWRARQGVRQDPLGPGMVDVSDLLILDGGAPFPETLDEAIPHVRPGIEVGLTERFTVVWEVYGLQVREPVQVTLGFTRGRPGFLTRVGEFLGILEPDRPVEVSFEETAPDQVESVFRAIELELPELDPGEYTLHLRLETPGREPVITSRPIVVVDD